MASYLRFGAKGTKRPLLKASMTGGRIAAGKMDIHAFKAWAEPEDLSTRTAVMLHDKSPTRDGSEGQQRCDFMEPEDGLQEWRGCGKPACGLWAGSTMLAVGAA
ncbi:uncharacterized protein UV8b_05844 [Ustilaginoidea virens]|uniref:Uncharacterized protein n=1 Tax=Ustilaginoidea virens TaxID=1159556 RepID=A0A8E5MJ24_USTVR|nr:uncharacterized protein UV8b_05844 [Ustilaginoidea virens]QUC21601.1 hypothetical protein UV8b_05844 [Ustilaginoidea virens]